MIIYPGVSMSHRFVRRCPIICMLFVVIEMYLVWIYWNSRLTHWCSLVLITVYPYGEPHYILNHCRDSRECWIVCLCKNLHKHDHVSEHYYYLWRLPLEFLIQCSSLQFHRLQYIPLQPPVLFGRQHHHHTRTYSSFAYLPRYNLSFSQRPFCY